MSYRPLLVFAAVVLLVLAATTIDTQQIVWNPPWPVRLGMGGVGVFLAFVAAIGAGKPRRDSGEA
jgi:hypothetical protein